MLSEIMLIKYSVNKTKNNLNPKIDIVGSNDAFFLFLFFNPRWHIRSFFIQTEFYSQISEQIAIFIKQ